MNCLILLLLMIALLILYKNSIFLPTYHLVKLFTDWTEYEWLSILFLLWCTVRSWRRINQSMHISSKLWGLFRNDMNLKDYADSFIQKAWAFPISQTVPLPPLVSFYKFNKLLNCPQLFTSYAWIPMHPGWIL